MTLFRTQKVPPGPEGVRNDTFVKIISLRVDMKYKFSKTLKLFVRKIVFVKISQKFH